MAQLTRRPCGSLAPFRVALGLKGEKTKSRPGKPGTETFFEWRGNGGIEQKPMEKRVNK